MINKISKMFITIIIIISAILMGSPLKSNIEIANSLIILLAICYGISKFRNKKLIINKLDVFVMVLSFSSLIPLMFNSYISLEETILSVFQYMAMLSIYFLVKDLKSTWINNSILIGCLIIFILGIDNLTTNIFETSLLKLGVLHYKNGENRFIANLGYANSAAVIMAISFFISRIKQENNLGKWFADFVAFGSLIGIILSVSKGTILCFAFFVILYVLLMKNKRLDTIINLLIIVFWSFTYVLIFKRLLLTEKYIIIWLLIPVIGFGNCLLLHYSYVIKKYIEKIKTISIIFVSLILAVVLIILFIVGLNQKVPLTMFMTDKGTSQIVHTISNIKGDSIYDFVFYISSKSQLENGFIIRIDEENKYNQKIESHKIEIGTFKGKKELNILTNKDTSRIKIYFERREKENEAYLTIEKLTINNKEIGLNYKYLPMQLVDVLKSITTSNKSVWERGVFIQDSIKLVFKYGLLGIGGNGWNYTYGLVQEYAYQTSEAHCYYTQIIIQNGILGGIGIIRYYCYFNLL